MAFSANIYVLQYTSIAALHTFAFNYRTHLINKKSQSDIVNLKVVLTTIIPITITVQLGTWPWPASVMAAIPTAEQLILESWITIIIAALISVLKDTAAPIWISKAQFDSSLQLFMDIQFHSKLLMRLVYPVMCNIELIIFRPTSFYLYYEVRPHSQVCKF